MARDEVREAIMACIQKAQNPADLSDDTIQQKNNTTDLDEVPTSRFYILDMAILKKYSTK